MSKLSQNLFFALLLGLFSLTNVSHSLLAGNCDDYLDNESVSNPSEGAAVLIKLSSPVNLLFDAAEETGHLRQSLHVLINDFAIQSIQPAFSHPAMNAYLKVKCLSPVDVAMLEQGIEALPYIAWARPIPTVEAAFATDFSNSICLGQTVRFYNQSIAEDASLLWSFEGANISQTSEQNPEVMFLQSGSYSVSLTVESPEGTDVLTQQIVVDLPSAKLTGGGEYYASVKQNLKVEFSGMPPFDLVYSDGTTETLIEGIENPLYYLPISPVDGSEYKLVSMKDKFCNGNISGTANFELRGGDPNDPEYLVQEVLVAGGCIEVENVEYTGDPSALGYYEQSATLDIGFAEGVFMATGDVSTFDGPNDDGGAGTLFMTPGDEDLEQVLGGLGIGQTNDAAILEFDFKPSSDAISFEYIFASEEYPEYVCSNFNDVFAFFISGPGIDGPYSDDAENIALIPSTDIAVAINSVNPGVVGLNGLPGGCTSLDYSEYYVDNTGGLLTEFDGYTTILTAELDGLTACETYHIKLAIADVFDSAFDSGVFLKANSFGADVPFLVEAIGVNNDPVLAEGCNEGAFVFTRGDTENLDEEIEVIFTIAGSASNGEDYEEITETLVIEAGEETATIPIVTIADGVAEGDETIDIVIENAECNCESTFLTATLTITETATDVEAGPDLTICPGGEAQLDATVPDDVDFTWSSPETLDDPMSTIPIATPTETTEYVLTVVDADGCFGSDTVTVFVAGAIDLPTLEDISICTEASEVTVEITGVPENDDWTYSWDPEDGLDDPNAANPTATVSGPAEYTLTVEDADGCSGSTSVAMVATQIAVEIEYDEDVVLCTGDELTLEAVSVAGASFQWQDDSSEATFTVTESGTYTVVATAGECEASTSVDIEVIPAPVVDLGPDQFLCGGEQIILDATVDGDASYLWMDGTTEATHPVDGAGEYSVEVTVGGACTASDSVSFSGELLPALNEDYFLICEQEEIESILVSVGNPDLPDPDITYSWSTGSTEQSILIGPEDVGWLWVDITGEACSYRDSLELLTYPCVILDVELLSFRGETKGQDNLLSWSTASEVNADYFELHRSLDGNVFQTIERIETTGNSSQYSHLDLQAPAMAYYRLQMVDLDASAKYSELISISRNEQDASLQITPIPARDQLTMSYNFADQDQVQFTLLDLNGRVLMQHELAASGTSNIALDGIASGLYLVQLTSGNEVLTSRVIVQ